MDIKTRSAALLGLLTALSGGIFGCSRDQNASNHDPAPRLILAEHPRPPHLPSYGTVQLLGRPIKTGTVNG